MKKVRNIVVMFILGNLILGAAFLVGHYSQVGSQKILGGKK